MKGEYMKRFNDLSVFQKAYIIVTVYGGSWLYNTLSDLLQEEDFCSELVSQWKKEEGVGDIERFEEYMSWSPQAFS
jgi:hypothetical protein